MGSPLKLWLKSWSRPEIVSAVFVICILNGLATRIQAYVAQFGWNSGLFSLFGISALIYICIFLALDNVLSSDKEAPLSKTDIAVYVCAVAVNLISSPITSWVALSIVAAREYLGAPQNSLLRRGSALMLAASVPLFWSRLVFTIFSNFILKIDAALISLMTGTKQIGNAVALPDGSGYVWIADACSSFGNISLAMLCWCMFMAYRGRKESTVADYVACISACFNVVIVNITRISFIAFRPELYNFVHGPYGAAIAGYISTGLVVLICSLGIKRGYQYAA